MPNHKPPQPIEHEHKFVIPVEYRFFKPNATKRGVFIQDCKLTEANQIQITKLRCECGEEIER